MKYLKKLLLPLCVLVIAIVYFTLNITTPKDNKITTNISVPQSTQELPEHSVAALPTTASIIYTFDHESFEPGFSLELPASSTPTICDDAGCWEATIAGNNYDLYLDMNAIDTGDFEIVAEQIITNFGSEPVIFGLELIDLADMPPSYRIYKVSADGDNYLLGLVLVNKVAGTNGYLAIKMSSQNEVAQLMKIINSITYLE